jgi:hypothetical protein
MEFSDITYVGPAIDDLSILAELPSPFVGLLGEQNGFVAFRGGLHVRGACEVPAWHALRIAWKGERALGKLFKSLQATDVPFAEDALGDQFILRDAQVWRLEAESDTLEPTELDVLEFLENATHDPVGFLRLQPLLAFEAEGGRLAPGQLLSVYPPFVAATDAKRSYRAVKAADRLGFLASFAEQLRSVSNGQAIQFSEYRSERDH